MDAEQTGKRRRRSRLEAEHLAAEFEKSGLSRKTFSREHGLSVHTLDNYRRRSRQRRSNGDSPSRMLAVEISEPVQASSGELTIALTNGRRIEVKRGFDADTLKQLMALLERG
jgi:transposase-like protein